MRRADGVDHFDLAFMRAKLLAFSTMVPTDSVCAASSVMCMELFDHLPNLDRALASMRSVVKPGGRFAFTYVPSESLYGRAGNVYRALRRRLRPEEMMISRTYSFKQVEESLRKGGFKLDRHFGVGVLCLNAQTRLFREGWLSRATLGLARAESRQWPYHERPFWARRGAHVVGLARPV